MLAGGFRRHTFAQTEKESAKFSSDKCEIECTLFLVNSRCSFMSSSSNNSINNGSALSEMWEKVLKSGPSKNF